MALMVLYPTMDSHAKDKNMPTVHPPINQDLSANPIIHDLNRDRNSLQEAVDWWNKAYIAGLILTVLIAGFTGLSQFKAIMRSKALVAVQQRIENESGRLLEEDLKRKDLQIGQLNKDAEAIKSEASKAKRESEEKIAGLSTQAEQLRADAEKSKAEIASAQAEAARANERAAEANRKTEEERLARVRIEERIASRAVGFRNEHDNLVGLLKPFAGSHAVVNWIGGDQESRDLSVVVAETLRDSGWNVTDVSNTTFPAPVGLIWRIDNRSAAGRSLIAALSSISMAAIVPLAPTDDLVAVIVVGVKPPL